MPYHDDHDGHVCGRRRPVNLRFDPRLWERIKEAAARENRTATNWLETAAIERLQRQRRQGEMLTDAVQAMIRAVGRYQALLHDRGALSAQEQEQRQSYVAALPEPLRLVAEEWVALGRDAVLRPVDDVTLGLFESEYDTNPYSTFVVGPEVVEAVRREVE